MVFLSRKPTIDLKDNLPTGSESTQEQLLLKPCFTSLNSAKSFTALGATVRRKRRSWSVEEKRRIVDESLEIGASIAAVARRHDLNANQLFTWRRQLSAEPLERNGLAPILPVTIAPDAAAEHSP